MCCCDEHAEAHAREVEDSLCHYKAHREEEVGGREVGEDQEREGKQNRCFLSPDGRDSKCCSGCKEC